MLLGFPLHFALSFFSLLWLTLSQNDDGTYGKEIEEAKLYPGIHALSESPMMLMMFGLGGEDGDRFRWVHMPDERRSFQHDLWDLLDYA